MTNGDLDPLYKDRKITLWVEDGLTRDYLTAAWDDHPAVRLLIAGSSDSVRALVDTARKQKYASVFGLCDRDFGSTNYSKWSPTTQVFRLQMHEIENALLDPATISAALATFGKTLTAADIHTKLATEARSFVWGMALGSTLSWVRTGIDQDFPPSTGLVNVPDQTTAVDKIVKSAWWQTHFPKLPKRFTVATVTAQLGKEHATYAQHLGSDAFLANFAGKELLGRVSSWLIQGGGSQRPTDADLAKTVGTLQRQAGRLPQEVSGLLATLLKAI